MKSKTAQLMDTITSRPAASQSRATIVFSPHPDDDVISMGGTLINLVNQGHDVQIAYMTSGNIAVFDHDALRHIDYLQEFNQIFGLDTDSSRDLQRKMRRAIASKQPGDPDIPEVLNVKLLIST